MLSMSLGPTQMPNRLMVILSFSANSACALVGFLCVLFITDYNYSVDGLISDHGFHESDGIVTFSEVPLVENNIDAGINQSTGKFENPLFVNSRRPTIRDKYLWPSTISLTLRNARAPND